jgi:hypothetical protein
MIIKAKIIKYSNLVLWTSCTSNSMDYPFINEYSNFLQDKWVLCLDCCPTVQIVAFLFCQCLASWNTPSKLNHKDQSSEAFQKLKIFGFNLCKTFQNHFDKIFQFSWCPILMASNYFFKYGLKTISCTVSKTISHGQKLIQNLYRNIHISESLLAMKIKSKSSNA